MHLYQHVAWTGRIFVHSPRERSKESGNVGEGCLQRLAAQISDHCSRLLERRSCSLVQWERGGDWLWRGDATRDKWCGPRYENLGSQNQYYNPARSNPRPDCTQKPNPGRYIYYLFTIQRVPKVLCQPIGKNPKLSGSNQVATQAVTQHS